MGIRSEEEERQLRIILLPSHQPVGFDVALPNAVHVARQFVWPVMLWQRASGFKQVHRVCNKFHVKPTLDAAAELFLEAGGEYNLICHSYNPISL